MKIGRIAIAAAVVAGLGFIAVSHRDIGADALIDPNVTITCKAATQSGKPGAKYTYSIPAATKARTLKVVLQGPAAGAHDAEQLKTAEQPAGQAVKVIFFVPRLEQPYAARLSAVGAGLGGTDKVVGNAKVTGKCS
jgi:hypothetical protein